MSPNIRDTTKRAPAGRQIIQMLLDGELDAVLGEKSDHPDLKPLFADVAAEEKAWFARHGVVPVNHMVVVSRTLCEKHPDIVREVQRMLKQAADGAAGAPRFTADEMRRSLEMIIGYSAQQKLIPRAYAVDELFDDVTACSCRGQRRLRHAHQFCMNRWARCALPTLQESQ